MADSKSVQAFLDHSQQDQDTATKILAAISKGGEVTANEVMKVAAAAGYKFSKEEFEAHGRKSIAARYKAGEHGLAATVNAKDSPESSCAKGCLSYTTSWHPDPIMMGAIKSNPAVRKR